MDNDSFSAMSGNMTRLSNILKALDIQLQALNGSHHEVKVQIDGRAMVGIESEHLYEAIHKTRQNVHKTMTEVVARLTQALAATKDTLIQTALPSSREEEAKEA